MGLHVLVEKPIAATLEEADALIVLANARGVVLQTGHLERFNAAFMALADVLKELLFVESTDSPRSSRAAPMSTWCSI